MATGQSATVTSDEWQDYAPPKAKPASDGWQDYQGAPAPSGDSGELSEQELTGKSTPAGIKPMKAQTQTQFEKDREGEGYLSGLKHSLPALGSVVRRAAFAGFDPVSDVDSLKDLYQNTGERIKKGWEAGKVMTGGAPNPIGSAATAGAYAAGPLVGVDPLSVEKRAEHGDTAGIAGELTLPTVAALAPVGAHAVGKIASKFADKALTPAVPPGLSEEATANLKEPIVRRGTERLARGIEPTAGNTNFRENLATALPDLKAIEEQNPLGKSGKTGGIARPDFRIRQTLVNIDNFLDNLWQKERQPQIERNADATTLGRSGLGLSEQDLAAVQAKLGREIPQQLTLRDADGLLKDVNARLRKVNSMDPKDAALAKELSPTLDAFDQMHDRLHAAIGKTLVERGEEGIMPFNKRYAALSAVEDSMRRRMNPAESSRLLDNLSLRAGAGIGPGLLERLHVKSSPGRNVQKGLEALAQSDLATHPTALDTGVPPSFQRPHGPNLPGSFATDNQQTLGAVQQPGAGDLWAGPPGLWEVGQQPGGPEFPAMTRPVVPPTPAPPLPAERDALAARAIPQPPPSVPEKFRQEATGRVDNPQIIGARGREGTRFGPAGLLPGPVWGEGIPKVGLPPKPGFPARMGMWEGIPNPNAAGPGFEPTPEHIPTIQPANAFRATAPRAPMPGVLPGMEEAVAKQAEGAAKVKGEDLTRQANTPKDINQAAGEMESKSPLFRGTEASPQKEIFAPGGESPAAHAGEPPTAEELSPEHVDLPKLKEAFTSAEADRQYVADEFHQGRATYKELQDAQKASEKAKEAVDEAEGTNEQLRQLHERLAKESERESPERIDAARQLIFESIDKLKNAERPGRKFITWESGQENTGAAPLQPDSRRGETHGGKWLGVTSTRETIPWLKNRPKWGWTKLEAAMMSGKSKLYNEVLRAADDYLQGQTPEGKEAIKQKMEQQYIPPPPPAKFVNFQKPTRLEAPPAEPPATPPPAEAAPPTGLSKTARFSKSQWNRFTEDRKNAEYALAKRRGQTIDIYTKK